MTGSTRVFPVRITTAPTRVLQFNANRSSYYIINQDPAVAVFVASGTSNGPHVAVAGNHVGYRLGPNGGDIYDDDDIDEVWMVAAAVNNLVIVTEKVKSGRLTADKRSIR